MNSGWARLDETLVRFGATHRAAVRAEWAAAQAAGLPLVVVDDGTLLLGAAPAMASTMFNRGLGLAERPDLLGTVLAFFAEHGVQGDVALDPADLPPGVEPRLRLDVHVGPPGETGPATVDGLALHVIDGSDEDAVATWMRAVIEANAPPPDVADLWRRMAPFMARTPGWTHLVGTMDGDVVAAGSLFEADGVGWQSWASVVPAARGRGIQRALIGARSRLAAERGCDLVAAWALAGAHSSANLERAGLARIGQRLIVRSADLVAGRRARLGPHDPATAEQVDLPRRALRDGEPDRRPGSASDRSGRTRTIWRPTSASRAPPPCNDGRNRSPSALRNRNVVPGTSSTPISSAVRRPGSAAREARSSAVHSALVGSCSMRKGGESGSRVGAAASRQRTTRPSGRCRSPAWGGPMPEPAARRRAASASTSSVAIAQVARPVPASDPRTRRAGRPTHDSAASCGSKTPISSR